MRNDQCPTELSVMEMNGYCTLKCDAEKLTLSFTHTKLVAAVLENTGAIRGEGKANPFLQTQLGSDSPSGIPLKHRKCISSSSHL